LSLHSSGGGVFLPSSRCVEAEAMPPKKGGKKKGKAGKKSKDKTPKIDPEVQKAEKRINEKYGARRQVAVRLIGWVDVARQWFRSNLAVIFDAIRAADVTGAGHLDPIAFLDVLQKCRCPLDREQQETLTMAIDLQKSGLVDYCQEPATILCYGGGFMETVNRGLERVMVAHRQELAEIDMSHAEELNLLKMLGVAGWKEALSGQQGAAAALLSAHQGNPGLEGEDEEEVGDFETPLDDGEDDGDDDGDGDGDGDGEEDDGDED